MTRQYKQPYMENSFSPRRGFEGALECVPSVDQVESAALYSFDWFNREIDIVESLGFTLLGARCRGLLFTERKLLHRDSTVVFGYHGGRFRNALGGCFASLEEARLDMEQYIQSETRSFMGLKQPEEGVEPERPTVRFSRGKLVVRVPPKEERDLDDILQELGPGPVRTPVQTIHKTIAYCKYGHDSDGKAIVFESQSKPKSRYEDSHTDEPPEPPEPLDPPFNNERAFRKAIVRMQRAAQADLPSRKGSRKKFYKKSERLLERDLKGVRLGTSGEEDDELVLSKEGFKEKFVSQVNIGLVHKMDPKMSETISGICDKFADIFEGCKGNVEETIGEVRSSIDKGLGIADNLKSFLWIALLATLGYFFFVKAPLHRVVIITILAAVIPVTLWSAVSHIFSGELISQGGLNLSWMSQIVTIGLTFFLFGGTNLFSTVKNVFKTMPTYSRTVNGVTDVGAFLVGNIEHCFNFLRKKFGKGPVSLMSTGKKEIDQFVDRVQEVTLQASTEAMEPKDFLLALQELRGRGAILQTQHRWAPLYERVLSKAVSQLDSLIETFAPALHAMKSTRIEPTLIGLVGAPRQGKSILMDAISKFLLYATLPDDVINSPDYDPRQHTYARCASSEYWTGYYRQFVVIIDDWGQSKPSPGDASDVTELINMCSPAPFCPNQAAVADKGRYYFDSPFVIASTNLVTLDGTASVIASPAALAARFELSYKAIPKTEFRKWCPEINNFMLDGEKFTRESAACSGFPWHIWNFYKHDFSNPNGHAEPIGHETMLRGFVERYRRNKDRFENVTNLDDSINNFARTFRSQMGLPFLRRNKNKNKEAPEEVLPESLTCIPGHVEALTGFRDGLVKELDSTFFEIGKWLKGIAFVLAIIGTPFVVSSILKSLLNVVRYIFKIVGRMLGFSHGDKKETKRKENVAKVRKLVNHLDPDELGELADSLEKKVSEQKEREKSNKIGNKLGKAAGFPIKVAFISQSNTPTFRVRCSESVPAAVKKQLNLVSQAGGQTEEINESLGKNQFLIKVKDKDGVSYLGTLTVLENDFCMIPNHFLSSFQAFIDRGDFKLTDIVELINVWTPMHRFTLEIGVLIKTVAFVDEGKDLAILKIPSIQRRRSIVDKFILKADVEYLHKCNVRLETCKIVKGAPVHYISYGYATREYELVIDEGGPVRKLSGWLYDIETVKGNCGSLVSLVDNSWTGPRRIIGFHSAGSEAGNKGLANGLTQEYIRDTLDGLGSIKNVPLPETKKQQEVFFSQNGGGEALFVVDEGVSQNPNSRLFKTPLFGKWGDIDKVPALLNSKEGINPMAKVRAEYLRPHATLDPELVSRATSVAFRPFKEASIESPRLIFNIRQSCKGEPAMDYNGLKRGSSAGFPYNAMGFQGKKSFFGSTGEFDFTSKAFLDLEKEVLRVEALAKQGIRSLHVYTDFLKDELRSSSKVKEGKSRMISAAPLVYTILFRMYFGAFTAAVEKHRIETGPAVGINPYTEWERIVRKLRTKGPHIVAGDYGGFDHTSRPQNQDSILEEIQQWYGDEHEVIRRVLWKELTNSVHITGDPGTVARQIYSWVGGMPSGFPGTTTINCFDNITDMILAFHDVTGLEVESFWDYVALIVYGDDNIMSVHPDVVKFFNQSTIPQAMEKLGRKYTDDKKKADSSAPYRNLQQVTFLKRSFRKLENKWLAPLDLESVLLIPYWGKTHMGEKEILGEMVECSLQELSLHEPKVWDEYAPKISGAATKYAKYIPKMLVKQNVYLENVMKRTEQWF